MNNQSGVSQFKDETRAKRNESTAGFSSGYNCQNLARNISVVFRIPESGIRKIISSSSPSA